MATKKEKTLLRKHGLKKLDKPKRTPRHKTKSHVVVTRVDGKAKVIRFGSQGADTKPRNMKSQTEADKAKRAAFKKRHAKNIARGKRSAAWWANKFKW